MHILNHCMPLLYFDQKLSRKMSVAGPMDEEIAAVAATTDYISKDRTKGKGRRGRTVSWPPSPSLPLSLSLSLSLPLSLSPSLFSSTLSLSFLCHPLLLISVPWPTVTVLPAPPSPSLTPSQPTRTSRLLSDPGIEEPNIKDTLQKYDKVREVSWELG